MAVRFYVQIAFADNGGMIITGPVHEGAHVSKNNKLYITESLDPKKIGEMFLAFQADYKLHNDNPDTPF